MARSRRPRSGGRKPPGDLDIPQMEADRLIRADKYYLDSGCPVMLEVHGHVEINLALEEDHRERFSVFVDGNSKDPEKVSISLVARRSIVLLRLDLGGPNHGNPDGEIIPCPHLHRYLKGEGDSYARPAEEELDLASPPLANVAVFLQYCNVVQLPELRLARRLFQ